MQPLKAHVKDGRIVLDEPTDLPEGQVFELFPVQLEDSFDEDERIALHRALERGSADVAAGRTVSADDLLARLEARE